MQKILVLISSLFQRLSNALRGGDSWFLVIDEVIIAQEDLVILQKQFDQRRDQAVLKDSFNRRYESQSFFSSNRLTISEIWITLSPISLSKFLRYSLSDVVWLFENSLTISFRFSTFDAYWLKLLCRLEIFRVIGEITSLFLIYVFLVFKRALSRNRYLAQKSTHLKPFFE